MTKTQQMKTRKNKTVAAGRFVFVVVLGPASLFNLPAQEKLLSTNHWGSQCVVVLDLCRLKSRFRCMF